MIILRRRHFFKKIMTKKIIDQINLNTEEASLEENINIPEIAIVDGFMEIELPPGVYE